MLRETILIALQSLTPWSHELETAEQRKARMAVNADAITSVVEEFTCADNSGALLAAVKKPEKKCRRRWHGSALQLAAGIIVLGDEESRWASHIQKGQCGKHPKSRPGECDAGLAVSPFQLQRNLHMSDDHWATMQTVEGARLATWFAARYLAGYYGRCKQWFGAYASYGMGRYRCNPDHTKTPKKWKRRSYLVTKMYAQMKRDRARLLKENAVVSD